MTQWVLFLAALTAIAATGFVLVAIMWLRKLRQTVATALSEAAHQQVRVAQRLSETVGQVQKQQRSLEQQMLGLAQTNVKLRQDITAIASRVELSEREQRPLPLDRTLH